METGLWLSGTALVYYALLAGLERAFFRVNRLKVALRVSQGYWLARHANVLLAAPSRFFLATRLGKLVALAFLVVGGWWLASSLAAGKQSHLIEALVALGLLVLLVLLGELLVRWVFQSAPNALFTGSAPLVAPFFLLVAPLRWFTQRAERRAEIPTNPLSGEAHLLPYPPLATGRLRKEDFLENELLENSELDTEVFSKALQLNVVRVREFMVPRTEIIAMPSDSTFAQLHQKFVETEVSRIVIYGENLDEVHGYVHSIALLQGQRPVAQLLQPVMFVPETMSASSLLGEVNRQHRSLAIVLDEYGGTAGLVTVEDLVEVVFGEIEDEYDEPEADALTEREVAPSVFHFAGRLEVEYLNRTYQLHLPTGGYSTLGGLVLHLAERLPTTGETFRCGNLLLTVLQATPRKVELVKVEKRR